MIKEIKLFFACIFDALDLLLEYLPGDYPTRRPWPIRMLTSWIATLALMLDEEAMASLRRAIQEARTEHMHPYLTHEEVFGDDFD